MTSTADKVKDIAQEFIDTYDLDQGNGEIDIQDGDLYMEVEGTNNTTVQVSLPASRVTPEELAQALRAAIDGLDVDDTFDELWSPEFGEHNGLTPSEFLKMLQEDKAELTLKAAQAEADNGIKPSLDPDQTILDVQMNINDIQHMLTDGGISPTPHNTLQAIGDFAGRDGYYLAGYAAVQGASLLKDIMREGRAHEYGFTTSNQDTREPEQPER